MKFRLAYIFLLAGLVSSACSDVLSRTEAALDAEDCIIFSASNARMITKAGLDYENFETGTRYLLYGVESSGSYDWSADVLKDRQPVESESHHIDYGADIHFRNKTYDFYGATVCSTTDVPATDGSQRHIIQLSTDSDGKLTDLMYSNNLKGCSRRSGLLQMDFIHALSKIQVEVAKQTEDEVVIRRIAIKDTPLSGSLNIVTGEWNLTEGAVREFHNQNITVSKTASMIQTAGKTAEMLIFPNGTNMVSLMIEYSVAGVTYTKECEIVKPKSDPDTDKEAFTFEQNHRYTLSIVISGEDVHMVSVLPKVYEWITEIPFAYLGQPVTFGNLMWMDRNLGALSADYENDWYNTIGHYFQFGRNIPYILNVERFLKYVGDGKNDNKGTPVNFSDSVFVMKYAPANGSGSENEWYYDNNSNYYTRKINKIVNEGCIRRTGSDWSALDKTAKTNLILNAVKCIYTFNHLGDTVFGVKYVEPSDKVQTSDVTNAGKELVRNPDYLVNHAGLSDAELTELYKFGYGTKECSLASNLKRPTVWTFDADCGREYWKPGEAATDPCPKGWRLPTKEDLEALMPSFPIQINWESANYPTIPANLPDDEEIRYGKISGKRHVCYILKNKGTNNAYRLRIMSQFVPDGRENKRYFSISRYGATSSDNLAQYLSDTYNASDPENNETKMWANPIETIYYPACGYIVPDTYSSAASVHPDLRSFGTGTVIRTANSNPVGLVASSSDGFSYVQYLSTTDYQLSIQQNSRRSLGDQIRCVRDINAVD